MMVFNLQFKIGIPVSRYNSGHKTEEPVPEITDEKAEKAKGRKKK